MKNIHKYNVGDIVKVKQIYHNHEEHYKRIGIIAGVIENSYPGYKIIIAGIEGKTFYIYEDRIEGKL